MHKIILSWVNLDYKSTVERTTTCFIRKLYFLNKQLRRKSKTTERCLDVAKARLREPNQRLVHQEQDFNSQSVVFTVCWGKATTLSELVLVPQSTWQQFSSICLLKSSSWPVTLPETTRKAELSQDIFNWPYEMSNDEELNRLLSGVTIAQGGVLPNIQAVLLPKKTEKKA